MPPITLGATLSACGVPDAARSPSIALSTTSRCESGRPSSSFAATAPAALLAPELPSPLASGICLCNHKCRPRAAAPRSTARRNVARRAARHVFVRVAAQEPPIAGDLDNFNAGTV